MATKADVISTGAWAVEELGKLTAREELARNTIRQVERSEAHLVHDVEQARKAAKREAVDGLREPSPESIAKLDAAERVLAESRKAKTDAEAELEAVKRERITVIRDGAGPAWLEYLAARKREDVTVAETLAKVRALIESMAAAIASRVEARAQFDRITRPLVGPAQSLVAGDLRRENPEPPVDEQAGNLAGRLVALFAPRP